MTLNLIFVTVTIKRIKKTLEQRRHDEEVFKIYDDVHAKRNEYQIRNF